MFPYWLFFLFPALAALAANPRKQFRADGTRKTSLDASWVLMLILLTAFCGLRFQVGGDWYNYFRYLDAAQTLDIWAALTREDPGYWFLNVLSVQLGWGITGVNLFGGFFFSLGLVLFCRSMPRPWLALAVAIPYMYIVVAMGYSRQSIALGFAMLGFLSLSRRSYAAFIFWVLVGATFHKTAVLLLPLAALTITKNRVLLGAIVVVASVIGYQVLLADAAEGLIENYSDEVQQSRGAFIRLAMNAVAGAIFLYYRRKIRIAHPEFTLWRLYAWMSLAMLVALFLLPISTALDRLGLYVLPLQLVVFSHLPDILGRYGRRNELIVFCVLLYYAAVQFVWLNFGTFSKLWLPYQIQFGV